MHHFIEQVFAHTRKFSTDISKFTPMFLKLPQNYPVKSYNTSFNSHIQNYTKSHKSPTNINTKFTHNTSNPPAHIQPINPVQYIS